jgi:hypothetical protein
MRTRKGTTSFQWIKGHNGEEGNEDADKLVAEGAWLPQLDILGLTIPSGTTHTGAKLSKLLQRDVYIGIKQQEIYDMRQKTKNMLDIVR